MYSQNGDEDGKPELLGVRETAAGSSEATFDVHTIGYADEDPHHDDGAPSREAVVAFKDAVREKKREMAHVKLGMPK